MDVVQIFLDGLKNHPVLSKEKEKELIQRTCDGDTEARDQLIRSNLRLAVFFAKRSIRHFKNKSLEDAIGAANLALLHTVAKIKPAQTCFASYFKHWVRYYLTEESNKSIIYIPYYQRAKYIPPKFRCTIDFENFTNKYNNEEDYDEQEQRNYELQQLKEKIGDLDHLEQIVIKGYLEGQNFAEIGKIVNKSRERIRQIFNVAVGKLQKTMRVKCEE